jgi:hypothetical protein
LLWFILGMGRSLMIASIVGLVGTVGLGAMALYTENYWLGLITLFAASQAWMGFKNAKAIR